MMPRDQLAADLAALTDAALFARCVREIAETRRYPSDRWLVEVDRLCWCECLARDRKDIYHAALEQVRADEQERIRKQYAATAALTSVPSVPSDPSNPSAGE